KKRSKTEQDGQYEDQAVDSQDNMQHEGYYEQQEQEYVEEPPRRSAFGDVIGKLKSKIDNNPNNRPDGADYTAQAPPKVENNAYSQGTTTTRRGVILFTGERKSGVTSTAVNAAKHLSNFGSTVLIDLDFLRNGVAYYFDK